jgi:hypothetical protein
MIGPGRQHQPARPAAHLGAPAHNVIESVWPIGFAATL